MANEMINVELYCVRQNDRPYIYDRTYMLYYNNGVCVCDDDDDVCRRAPRTCKRC